MSNKNHSTPEPGANRCESRLDSLDLFAADVPQLNFEGRTRVHTSVGIAMSMMVFMAVAVYSMVKFIDLYKGNDPNVTSNILYGMFSSD
jgi:hypothetical protein